ncbi:MAG: DUF6941 family protein [Spirochaetota bacterium]
MSEPVLVAILFADKVIVEKQTEKKSIIGTFTRFNTNHFPISFPPWFLYIAITNITGEHSFSLNLVLEEEKQVVFSSNGKLGSKSANAVVEMAIPVLGAVFHKAGIYTLTFNIDGNQVGARFLEVRNVTDSPMGE